MTEDQARAVLCRVKLCFDIAQLIIAAMAAEQINGSSRG